MTESRNRTVGIVIYEQVEVLDFTGPFEVFSVTRTDPEADRQSPLPYSVRLIAQSMQTVTATGGMRVLPDFSFSDCPALDILVVPGGQGSRSQMGNPELLRFITDRASEVGTVASVCTGSLLLAKSGLLDGKRATTHWRVLDLMQKMFPRVRVDRSRHVVADGDVVTSAGISAGIDMSLYLVAKQYGERIARATARQMEYPYPESDRRRIDL
jgi:transcriptional regulator GlxA family with amidase domain